MNRREAFCAIAGGIIGGTMMSLAKPQGACASDSQAEDNFACGRAHVTLVIREESSIRVIKKEIAISDIQKGIWIDDLPECTFVQYGVDIGNHRIFTSTSKPYKIHKGATLVLHFETDIQHAPPT